MHSYDIVGYTHSDGFCLCQEHAGFGDMPDTGSEIGKVYPIFAGDEWEYESRPCCDVCLEELDVVLLNVPEPPEIWSLHVSNIGYVHTHNPDYEVVKCDYDWYSDLSQYGYGSVRDTHVTLWSSKQDDPIEEYDPGDTSNEVAWHFYVIASPPSNTLGLPKRKRFADDLDVILALIPDWEKDGYTDIRYGYKAIDTPIPGEDNE